MTPTLFGRLQTRVVLLGTVGVVWTLVVAPILPRPAGMSRGDVLVATLQAIVVVGVVGLLWELTYHGLQQFRWEKDWPGFFGLLTGFPEGVTTYLVLAALREGPVPAATFVLHFASTWIVIWVFGNGPIRVLSLRWRYRGGRFI